MKSIFVESLRLEQEAVNSMVFSRCHRLPQGKSVKSTPAIIVRFRSYADRTLVWESKTRLKGTGFTLSENFDSDTAYNRKKLYPIFKKARSVSEKVSLKGDQLFIDGSQYGVESLDKLPESVHPSTMTTRKDGKTIVFGGIYSEFEPLSNWSPSPIVCNEIRYTSVEQGYQHKKALHFQDEVSALKILHSKSPVDAYKLGQKVNGFKSQIWSTQRYNVMQSLVRMKFTVFFHWSTPR